ncbi:MAG: family 78 glycoside hydrolase catalytic domain, partial [Spirochaetales bacterium]|nr:family 78 glycoside hydrolase catalytic domain [Spirochaetales bacterium]
MLKISTLLCDHHKNFIGLDTLRPSFSWVIISDGTGITQKSYELQISTDQSFGTLFWTSGAVESSQSQNVEYSGPDFSPVTRYWCRVRIVNNRNEQTPWSESVYFETSLLKEESWDAPFISSAADTKPEDSKGWLFHKELQLTSPLKSARLYATSLGVYEVLINGRRIGEQQMTPGWTNYKSRLLYQSYDISGELESGKNTVLAHVGPGWYKGDLAGWVGKRCYYGSRNGISLKILLCFEDGSEQWVESDESWTSCPSPVLYSEIYHGETFDARQESLEHPSSLKVWEPVECLSVSDKMQIRAQDGPLVLPREVLKVKEIIKDSQGRTILDFGQNMTGWVRFSVTGKSGDRVKLKHAEILHPENEFYTDNLRSARQEILYILKGEGTESYQPRFTFQGFRYVLVEEYPGDIRPEAFEAVVLHSRMEPVGTFSCSHPLLNQLHHNILWGMKGNFLDIPTDCPQRDERLGWTGDAQVFISTAASLMDTYGFFSKWLRDMRSEQLPDGGIPHVIPDVLDDAADGDDILGGNHSATGWADAMVICPWETYRKSGDLNILKENYEAMKNWVGYMRHQARDEVIWDSGFHFGDWVALDAKEGSYFGATPNDFTATVFYANSVDLMCRTSWVLGNTKDCEDFSDLYKRIVDAFQKEFFTPSGRLAVNTQTAHILALHFNLTPADYVDRTVNGLVSLLEGEKDHLTSGFLGTPYLCSALSRYGRLDKAYTLLLQEDYPSWLYQVKQGATTIWEHWDGLKPDGSLWSPDMNSFNHYA